LSEAALVTAGMIMTRPAVERTTTPMWLRIFMMKLLFIADQVMVGLNPFHGCRVRIPAVFT
jgi:hypothetical protein